MYNLFSVKEFNAKAHFNDILIQLLIWASIFFEFLVKLLTEWKRSFDALKITFSENLNVCRKLTYKIERVLVYIYLDWLLLQVSNRYLFSDFSYYTNYLFSRISFSPTGTRIIDRRAFETGTAHTIIISSCLWKANGQAKHLEVIAFKFILNDLISIRCISFEIWQHFIRIKPKNILKNTHF